MTMLVSVVFILPGLPCLYTAFSHYVSFPWVLVIVAKESKHLNQVGGTRFATWERRWIWFP